MADLDVIGKTTCPCGAAWIGTITHGMREQRSHAEFHASGGPGLGAKHDPGLASFVPDRTAHPSPADAPAQQQTTTAEDDAWLTGRTQTRQVPTWAASLCCALPVGHERAHLAAYPSPADAPAPQSLRDALDNLFAAIQHSDSSMAHRVAMREAFTKVDRAALDAPALTVEPDTALTLERLRDAIDAIDDPADTNRLWRAMSSQQLAIAILRALGEGAGEGVDRG